MNFYIIEGRKRLYYINWLITKNLILCDYAKIFNKIWTFYIQFNVIWKFDTGSILMANRGVFWKDCKYYDIKTQWIRLEYHRFQGKQILNYV